MKLQIFTVEKGKDKREEIELFQARERLEPAYYQDGTIDNLLKDKKDFTLQSSFFVYYFNFINKS